MPHHTLLHIKPRGDALNTRSSDSPAEPVLSNAAAGTSNSLLMTCRVVVHSPDGSTAEARALLDSGSSASFMSERLSQSLSLIRSRQSIKVHGIAGLSHSSPIQAIANFDISPMHDALRKLNLTAAIVPKVTCDLPLYPVQCDIQKWKHLSGIRLADPHFCHPGRIDLLLGVEIFTEVLRQGRQTGPPGSPIAIETEFGWVLAGKINVPTPTQTITSYHATITTDEMLQKFWEVEENPNDHANLSTEEKMVVQHFSENHYCTEEDLLFPFQRSHKRSHWANRVLKP